MQRIALQWIVENVPMSIAGSRKLSYFPEGIFRYNRFRSCEGTTYLFGGKYDVGSCVAGVRCPGGT